MEYFKNASRLGQYVDIQTGVVIRRGHIIALKQATKSMKPWILKRGILKVTEAEYQEWLANQPKAKVASNKETIPSDQLPPPVDEFAEQKKVIQADKKAAKPDGGSLVSSKNFFQSKSKASKPASTDEV